MTDSEKKQLHEYLVKCIEDADDVALISTMVENGHETNDIKTLRDYVVKKMYNPSESTTYDRSLIKSILLYINNTFG